MQLTTVGKEVWRAARQAERLDQAGAEGPTISERLRKLRLVETPRKRGTSWFEVQSLVGISRATYYRYRRRLKEEGLGGLKQKSKKAEALNPPQDVLFTLAIIATTNFMQGDIWRRWHKVICSFDL